MLRKRWVLVLMSCLLALHAMMIGWLVPSYLSFIVGFCWIWIAAAALLDRLEDARTMAATIIAILIVATILLKLGPLGGGNNSALFMLGLMPSVIAWACVYVYIRHIEIEDRLASAPLESLDFEFDESSAYVPPAVHAERFPDDLFEDLVPDNDDQSAARLEAAGAA